MELPARHLEIQSARDGVDLHRRDEVEAGRQRGRARRGQLAVGGEVVVIRDRQQPDARGVRLAQQLGRLQDAVGTERVRVEVGDRGAGDRRLVGRPGPVPPQGHGSTTRAIRSTWSARPVAGSTSTWQPLKMTGPSPTSNRVGRALMNRGRTVAGLKPITLQMRTRHPEVGLVGRALGQDPLVAGHHVGVRPDDHRHSPVEVQAEGVLLGRDLAVEVDEADRRQGLGGLVEQPVGLRERVVDLLHVGAALEVDDRELVAVERVIDAPSATRDAVGAVVERSQDALALVEVLVDLALVPDVVAGRDDVDARIEQRLGRGSGEPHPAGDVLAIGGDEVDAPLVADARQDVLDRHAPGLPDDVPDHQDPASRLTAAARCRSRDCPDPRGGWGGSSADSRAMSHAASLASVQSVHSA